MLRLQPGPARRVPVPGAGRHLGRRPQRRPTWPSTRHARACRPSASCAQFWSRLRSTTSTSWSVPAGCASAGCWRRVSAVAPRAPAAARILDTMPLVDTLHRAISLAGHRGRRCRPRPSTPWPSRPPATPAACTGPSATPRATASHEPWNRPGRRAEFQPLTIEHLMASSAIPFLFPATPLWVDGRREYFGDGSMRQVSPLSPAMHLGAHKILVVGVGQPQRSGLVGRSRSRRASRPWAASPATPWPASSTTRCRPTWSRPSASTRTLQQLPREVAGGAALPQRRGAGDPAHASRSTRSRRPHAHELPARGAPRAGRPGRAARAAAARSPATCCSSRASCRR